MRQRHRTVRQRNEGSERVFNLLSALRDLTCVLPSQDVSIMRASPLGDAVEAVSAEVMIGLSHLGAQPSSMINTKLESDSNFDHLCRWLSISSADRGHTLMPMVVDHAYPPRRNYKIAGGGERKTGPRSVEKVSLKKSHDRVGEH